MSQAIAYNFFEAPSLPVGLGYPPLWRSKPPFAHGSNTALSDRPTCRIYRDRGKWILQVQGQGGWLDRRLAPEGSLIFKTLAAAVRYADQHGLDYCIIPDWRTPAIGARLRRLGNATAGLRQRDGRE